MYQVQFPPYIFWHLYYFAIWTISSVFALYALIPGVILHVYLGLRIDTML